MRQKPGSVKFGADTDQLEAYAAFKQLGGRDRRWADTGFSLPEISGGDFVKHPLGPPQVVGFQIRVDTMLNQPTRITRMLSDITLQRFLLDRLFTNGGGVDGGAVVYDTATVNELYLDRDIERVEPGAEFPIVTSSRRAPSVAVPEKWGAKTYIEDEARDRNQTTAFTRELRKMGNTVVRKLNQRAIDILETAITANSGLSNATGHSWSTVVTGGSSQTNATGWPAADFAAAQLAADQQELGIVFDLWIVNPVQLANLSMVYGSALADVLRSFGLSIYASNRVTAGTAYAIAQGQLGEYRVEKPLTTETWRDQGRQITWVQSDVRPLMYVFNPFAVIKFGSLT